MHDLVEKITRDTTVIRLFWNNHPDAKTPYTALKFRKVLGKSLSSDEKTMSERLREHFYPKTDMA